MRITPWEDGRNWLWTVPDNDTLRMAVNAAPFWDRAPTWALASPPLQSSQDWNWNPLLTLLD